MKWGAVLGGVAFAVLASLPAALPARAADMSPTPRAIPATSGYIPAQFFWTGFYIGAGIGGSWDSATFTDPLVSLHSDYDSFGVSLHSDYDSFGVSG